MKRSVVFFLHAGYWMLLLIILLLFFIFLRIAMLSHHGTANWSELIVWLKLMMGFVIIPGVISYYSCYTFLFTHFLSKKKFFAMLLLGIMIVVLASVLGALAGSSSILYGPNFLFPTENNYPSASALMLFILFAAFVNSCFGLLTRGFITWYDEIKVREELNRKQYEMELALIKSQLDPHFLFNTINNIDVLIESEPLRASAYLNKLSEMMRFMLYETKTSLISLNEELAYLEKYVTLQKMRSSNSAYVCFKITGDPSNIMISPMLFFPLVENAFKYVADKKKEKSINIWVIIGKDDLSFICENTFQENSAAKTAEGGGIGAALIQKRLSLLYPDHRFKISRSDCIYRVEIIINRHDL